MTVARNGEQAAASENLDLDRGTAPPDCDENEQWLERVLIACEEARAAGLTPPDLASLVDNGSSGTTACERVHQALATLALKLRVSVAIR